MMRIFTLCTLLTAVSALATRQIDVARDLKSLVSSPSSVGVQPKARWSEFNAPAAGVVVKVVDEKDVGVVVSSYTHSKIRALGIFFY